MKAYDRAYFDRWYRDPTDRVTTREVLERKVRMAVSLAEYMLGRRIWSVLDVGCGEAPWYPVLRRLRPGVRYVGVDSSAYVLDRYGAERHIRRGTLGTLDTMRLAGDVDLIVCADVLQYVKDAEARRGLRAIRRLLGGIAYIEAFTSDDDMVGDRADWHERSADDYRALFRAAGLTQCGPYCYLDARTFAGLNTFERC